MQPKSHDIQSSITNSNIIYLCYGRISNIRSVEYFRGSRRVNKTTETFETIRDISFSEKFGCLIILSRGAAW